MSQMYAYLFMELCLLLSILVLAFDFLRFQKLVSRSFLLKAVGLFILWSLIDMLAVYAGVWHFQVEGTLPIRILGLPLEEFLLFPLHTLACLLIGDYFIRRREATA